MTGLERSTMVAAAPETVWEVLADFGAVSRWVPMIQHSCLLSDQTDGVGTLRRVQIARQTLVERVTTWDPPNALEYDIEGLPPVVGTAHNRWYITATPEGSTVTLTTEIATGRNPAKVLIAKKALEKMSIASDFMLAGLAEVLDATGGDSS